MTFRELVFEMGGKGGFSAHTGFIVDHTDLSERTRALHVFGDIVWEMNNVTGPAPAIAALRDIIAAPPVAPVVAREIVAEGPGWLTYCVRRERPKTGDAPSIEHIVHDALGGGALVRRSVRAGLVEYAIGGDDGDAMHRLYQFIGSVVNAIQDSTLHLVRVGDFRPDFNRAMSRPLKGLTSEDQEILRAALENGYYDEPKRCGVRELGDNLGFSKTVVARKLRSIERRALEALLTGPSSPTPTTR